jgi:hypothetical protein
MGAAPKSKKGKPDVVEQKDQNPNKKPFEGKKTKAKTQNNSKSVTCSDNSFSSPIKQEPTLRPARRSCNNEQSIENE